MKPVPRLLRLFLETFADKAYTQKKPRPFIIPDSIKFVNIDLFSGKPSNQNFITESFKYNFNFDKNLDLKIDESDNELKGFLLMKYELIEVSNKIKVLLENLRGPVLKKALIKN